MKEIEKRLIEEIEKDGLNVIHAGEFDNSSHFFNEIGQLYADCYYVYMDGVWYSANEQSTRIKEFDSYEESDEDAYWTYDFNFHSDVDYESVYEYVDGMSEEIVEFVKSTEK